MAKRFIVRGDIPKEAAIVIKDQPIVTPGVYYGVDLSEDAIKEHIRLTDWSDQYNKALIYGHRTNSKDKWKSNPSPDEWVGYYTVPEYKTEGVDKPGAYSDIYVYDQNFAGKLAYGGVRCGVSATFDNHYGGFRNLSIIDNPKCKDAFLNLADTDEDKLVSIEPQFLNLSDSPTNERGKNSNINMKNDNENKAKIEELEKQIADLKATETPKVEPVAEPVVAKAAPVEEPAKVEPTPAPVAPVAKPVVASVEPTPAQVAPVVEPAVTPAPVVMTGDKADDSKVVDAIENMANKVTEEIKRTAESQTVAPTDPNSKNDSRDDEVTQSLVEKYSSLHDLK